MTDKTVSLYITDIEAFLKGDFDYSMSVYRTEFFTEESLPPHWVKLGVIPLAKMMPSRSELTKLAVIHLEKEEKNIILDHSIKITDIENRKQKLLALPHLETTND